MDKKRIFIILFVCLAFLVCFSTFTIIKTFQIIRRANEIMLDLNKKVEAVEKMPIVEYQNKEIEVYIVEFTASEDEQKENLPECEEVKKVSLGEFKLTAYCSCDKCCGVWAAHRPIDENGNPVVYGASGAVLVAGKSIAVDPSVIPYGSEIEINGNIYRADDCGGDIKKNRIDVYFDSHQDAINFGVRYAEVFLIGD